MYGIILVSMVLALAMSCASVAVPSLEFEPDVLSYEGTGQWVVSEKEDPISGETNTSFILSSFSGRNVYGDPIYLVIRVKNNKTELYINWGDYVSYDMPKVTIKIGESAPKTSNQFWRLDSSKEGTFFFYGEDLAKSIMKSNTFVARCTPYLESPITAIFDTSGLYNLAKEHGFWQDGQ